MLRESEAYELEASTVRCERSDRLILLRAERVADEVINGALNRRVYFRRFRGVNELCRGLRNDFC
jgi:hypothetical protein